MSKQSAGLHHIGHFPVMVQTAAEGGYWVRCPVLEGCYSQGDTIEEALANIREAISLCVEDLPGQQRKETADNISLHFVTI